MSENGLLTSVTITKLTMVQELFRNQTWEDVLDRLKCGQVPPDQIGHAILHPVYLSVVSSQTGIAGVGPRRDFETKLLS
jgi:hypothetical protein